MKTNKKAKQEHPDAHNCGYSIVIGLESVSALFSVTVRDPRRCYKKHGHKGPHSFALAVTSEDAPMRHILATVTWDDRS